MRGTLWELLKVMVLKWILIKTWTIWKVFFQNLAKNFVWTRTARLSLWLQSCKSVTHCDCKVTSLWLQSHKSVTAKSQVCECKVTSLWLQSHKKAGAMQKTMNYSTCMIAVCAEQTEPYDLWILMGESLSEVCQSQSSVWDLKGAVFKACDCMWQTKKRDILYGGWLIGGHTPRFINRTAAPGSAVFPWFKMIFWDVLLHSQRHFDSFACDSCQFHWSTQQWVKTLELRDRITPHVSFFQESLSRCENEMGKARKRKEMVQDRLGERAVCDSVVCVSLCM